MFKDNNNFRVINLDYFDILQANINCILGQIESNNNNIDGKMRIANSNERNIKKLLQYVDSCREDVITRSISLFLSIALTIGSGVGVFALAKKFGNRDYYKEITTSYSMSGGLETKEKLVDRSLGLENSNKIFLNVYGIWEKTDEDTYKRIIKKYDVSDYKFDNFEDYLNYGLDYYNVNYEIIEQERDFPNSLYIKEYIEVEKSVVDTTEKIEYLDIFDFIMALGILYVIYIFSLMGFVYFSEYDFIFGQTSDLIDSLKRYREGNKITKNEMRKFYKINKEIMGLINNNELLKSKFIKLYENNILLLDNPEELYNKFNELTVTNDKKKVKIKA